MTFREGGPDWIPLYWLLRGELVPKVNVQVAPTDPLLVSQISRLAEAIGTVQTSDKRGNIVLTDSFETGMGCWELSVGSGVEGWVTRQNRKTGLQSFMFKQAPAEVLVDLHRAIPLIRSNRVGLEVSFAANQYRFSFEPVIILYDGQYATEAAIKVDVWNSVLQVYDYDLGDVTIADITNMTCDPEYWHTVKVVIDRSTGKYVRLVLDGVEYDVSQYGNKYPATEWTYSWVALYVRSFLQSTTSYYVWLDDVIITEED